MTENHSDKPGRLKSLDALRGFDMFFIFGGDSIIITLSVITGWPVMNWLAGQMEHAKWAGFTFYDNIFPLFLFIAGISFPLSFYKRQLADSRRKTYFHIIRRGVILVLLGFVYNGFLGLDFENQRYASVLGRIGLAWMFAALIFINTKRIHRSIIIAVILSGYWLLLATVKSPDAPSGADGYSMTGSIVGYIDRLFLPGQLYLKVHDPEGILSTIPAIATALLGMLTGEFILLKHVKLNGLKKGLILLAAGALLMVIGKIWNLSFPINKNLWTSSFVCYAGGLSVILFSIFYLIIDVWGYSKWAFFFVVIGMNSIVAYLASHFIDFEYTGKAVIGGIIHYFPENWQSLLSIIGTVIIGWCFLYFLFRKKWFLKV